MAPRQAGRLSASDSLLWRIESDPVLRSPILVVGSLDRSPTADGVAAMVDRATTVLPRLRQRIVPPPLGVGRPRWEEVDAPLAHHVRHVRATGGDLDAVLDLAEPDAAAAFDPARPPWSLTIVDGLDGGRAAIVFRFHHALTDGVGGIAIADRLFDRARRPARATVTTAPEDGDGEGGGAAAILAGGAAAARQLARAAMRPVPTAVAAARFGTSTVRLLAPAPPGSPELADRSLDRWLATSERPLAAMRRAGAAVDGTVNDVLLAGVAGGLARYHRVQGHPVPAVRVTMPISTRRPDDPTGGNRFVPARFTLPVDDPDPEARMRIAGAIARRWRTESAVGSADVVAAGLNLLPRPVVSRLFGGMLRSIDVDVTNVPGLDRAAFVGGARIGRLWAFAPPAGAALSVTLVSHERACCLGLACDLQAVADPEMLATCLDEGLDEVLALGKAAG